jgi:protein tyrosine/serine phosphatase
MSKVPIPDSYWLLEGQLLAGEYPGHLNEGEAKKQLRKILAAGIRSFIDLTEPTDPLEPYERVLRHVAAAGNIEVSYRRVPIRDMWVPTAALMAEILDAIESEIASGRPVYFHCWGGIGRTGTVAGCWLVEQGFSCDDALTRIMQLRVLTPDGWKDSPQTPEQRSFVRAWTPRPT